MEAARLFLRLLLLVSIGFFANGSSGQLTAWILFALDLHPVCTPIAHRVASCAAFGFATTYLATYLEFRYASVVDSALLTLVFFRVLYPERKVTWKQRSFLDNRELRCKTGTVRPL